MLPSILPCCCLGLIFHQRSFDQWPRPGEVGLPVPFVLHPVDPAAVPLDVDLVPGRHHLEQPPVRRAVEVFGVPLVEAVLGEQPPVAVAVLDAAAHGVGRRVDELLGQLVGQRMGLPVAHEHPHQAQRLGGGVHADVDPAAHGRVGTVGDDRHQLAVGQPVGPGVIGAGERPRELLPPQRQRDPPVRAAVVEGVDGAFGVAHQHHVLAGQPHGDRPPSHLRRPLHRVPVVAQARGGGVVGRPLRPVDAAHAAPGVGTPAAGTWAAAPPHHRLDPILVGIGGRHGGLPSV